MVGNFKIKKIKSWVLKSILALNETGIAQDIHVAELLKEFDIYRKEDAFMQSCLLFKYIVDYLETSKINTFEISIFLSIDLTSESNLFIGKPTSLAEVERLMDPFSIEIQTRVMFH
jgi:acetyltransferase-like isoleucine patch superfamily enzyme